MLGELLWGDIVTELGAVGQRCVWEQLDPHVLDQIGQRVGVSRVADDLLVSAIPKLSRWAQIDLAKRSDLGVEVELALARVRRVQVWQTLAERPAVKSEVGEALAKWCHPRVDFLVYSVVGLNSKTKIIERFRHAKAHRGALIALCLEYELWDLLAICGGADQIARFIPQGAGISVSAAAAGAVTLFDAGDRHTLQQWGSAGIADTRLLTRLEDLCSNDPRRVNNALAGLAALKNGGQRLNEVDIIQALYDSETPPQLWIHGEPTLPWETMAELYELCPFSDASLRELAGRDDAPDWVIEAAVVRWVDGPKPRLRAEHLRRILGHVSRAQVGELAAQLRIAPHGRPNGSMLFEQMAPLGMLGLLLEWFNGDPWRDRVISEIAAELESRLGDGIMPWKTFCALADSWGGTMLECVEMANLVAGVTLENR